MPDDDDVSSLYSELFDALSLMLITSLSPSNSLLGCTIETAGDAEPSGVRMELVGVIEASLASESDARSTREGVGPVFDSIDVVDSTDGSLTDEYGGGDVICSGRNKAVEAVCVGMTPGP